MTIMSDEVPATAGVDGQNGERNAQQLFRQEGLGLLVRTTDKAKASSGQGAEVTLVLHHDKLVITGTLSLAAEEIPLDKVIGCQILDERHQVIANDGGNDDPEEDDCCENVGIFCRKVCGESAAAPTPGFFRLHSYTETRKNCSEGNVKVITLVSHLFRIDGYGGGDGPGSASAWRDRILGQRRQFLSRREPTNPSRRALILVNPKSGPGKAVSIFRKTVEPLLTRSGLRFDLLVTTRGNQARDLVCSEPNLKSRWSEIVIISGDGLLYEVLQGLFRRSDWDEVRKEVAIAIIAGGSGNGLARSLTHEAGFRYSPNNGILYSAVSLVRGETKPMDLSVIQTHSGRTLYSFLSLGWGFLADVDIESERLRWMGEPRFTVWSIYRLTRLKTYHGRLSYRLAPPRGTGKEHIRLTHQSGDDGQSRNTDIWECLDSYDSAENLPCNAPKDGLTMPPLSEPVPSDWTVVEDDFHLVYAVNAPYIGATVKFAPNSTSDDGRMWLVVVRKGISKVDMARFATSMDAGKHIRLNFAEVHEVDAVRIEPLAKPSKKQKKGHLTVDGELLPYEAVQAEVLPSFIRIVR